MGAPQETHDQIRTTQLQLFLIELGTISLA